MTAVLMSAQALQTKCRWCGKSIHYRCLGVIAYEKLERIKAEKAKVQK